MVLAGQKELYMNITIEEAERIIKLASTCKSGRCQDCISILRGCPTEFEPKSWDILSFLRIKQCYRDERITIDDMKALYRFRNECRSSDCSKCPFSLHIYDSEHNDCILIERISILNYRPQYLRRVALIMNDSKLNDDEKLAKARAFIKEASGFEEKND